jgi:predicted metal-dependent phosphoesterase TrpH
MAKILKQYASLHMHSTHSDGVYTPKELVEIGKAEGYRALALTDHDTVTGNAEVIEECKKAGLDAIFGIEFSTESAEWGYGFHITAFNFDPEYPEMKEYLEKLSEKESDQTRVLFERGVEIGYIKNITWDEVLEYNKGITWLCNEHVFRAMKAKGLITDIQYPEFFETCFGKYRSQVPPTCQFMDVKDLIPLVHRAGGIAIVAHPHGQLHRIDKLVEYGLDGIEVWHSMLRINERREALELAKKYDLYVSGGCDHEGLLGGEYSRYEHPEDTIFWLPPLSAGTQEFFYNEIKNMKKSPDRHAAFDALLNNENIWVLSGSHYDRDKKA